MISKELECFLANLNLVRSDLELAMQNYLNCLIKFLSLLLEIENLEEVIKAKNKKLILDKISLYASDDDLEIFLFKVNELFIKDKNFNSQIENINLLLFKWYKSSEKTNKYFEEFLLGNLEGLKTIKELYPKPFTTLSIQFRRWQSIKNLGKINGINLNEYNHFVLGYVTKEQKNIISLELKELSKIDNERSNIIVRESSAGKINHEILIFVSIIATVVMIIIVIYKII